MWVNCAWRPAGRHGGRVLDIGPAVNRVRHTNVGRVHRLVLREIWFVLSLMGYGGGAHIFDVGRRRLSHLMAAVGICRYVVFLSTLFEILTRVWETRVFSFLPNHGHNI